MLLMTVFVNPASKTCEFDALLCHFTYFSPRTVATYRLVEKYVHFSNCIQIHRFPQNLLSSYFLASRTVSKMHFLDNVKEKRYTKRASQSN